MSHTSTTALAPAPISGASPEEMITPEEIAEALRQHGSTVTGSGPQWSAQCPVHDDNDPSLRVGTGEDGRPLVFCQRGCETQDVTDALGIPWHRMNPPRQRQRVVATYPYCDESGALLYEIRRIEPGDNGRRKTFRPYLPGATRSGLGQVRRVLYRLPEIITAAAEGRTVYVVEGEKDVDRLRALGHVATCNPGGAGPGKWRSEYSRHLTGAHVIVIADRDTPGQEHARAVASSLTGHAASIRLTMPAVAQEGADLTDHLAAGHTIDDLLPLVEEDLADTDTDDDQAPGDVDPIAARAAELRAALLTTDDLDSIPEPEPLIDGVLMRDSLAWVYGAPGSAKSFAALDWAGHVATGRPWHGRPVTRGTVLYLAAEGASGVPKRVRAWEAHHGVKMRGLMLLPQAVQFLTVGEVDALARLVEEIDPVMIVVDTQARVTVGAEENSARDMGRLVAAVDQLREASGACVLTVHHSPRGGENLRGSTALEGAAHTSIRVVKDGPRVSLTCVKQKDSEPFEAVPLVLESEESSGSAVLVPDTDVVIPIDPVQSAVSALDRLGVPDSAGRPTAQRALSGGGLQFGTDVVAAAVKVRKNRTNGTNDLTSPSDPVTVDQPDLDLS